MAQSAPKIPAPPRRTTCGAGRSAGGSMPSSAARRSSFETFQVNGRDLEFEVLAESSGAFNSFGPMTRERREYVCRRGSTYWLLRVEEEDVEPVRIGYRKSELAGFAACVRRSASFVLSPGEAVSMWVDEDQGIELVDETWDPDDFDDEDEDNQPPAAQLALWDTIITDSHGVVLVGPGAATTLPATPACLVIPGANADTGQFGRLGIATTPVRISVDGQTTDGLLLEAGSEVVTVRLGSAFGGGTAWLLTVDAVQLVDCGRETITATALRDRVG